MKNEMPWGTIIFAICIIVAVVVLMGCCFVPMFIRMAKDMWLWALA